MAVSRQRADHSRCGYCGSHASRRFRRVYGDANKRAHRCPDCDSWPRIAEGSAAGHDAETPDPQENPGRSGGRWSA
ncbi:DUF7563 family protein [Salinarchaeum laminariae]|uniref:DUF7563 family protein n=1 Tax=Salinarchaeum laminariae TaxID=869888 RepID=UPI0020BE6A50|nr:hypothetical protein [Salinarchaeum laminariae]